MTSTAENMTVAQARKALELFDSEYIGQDGQQLWEWALGEVMKPQEAEYRFNDPVEVLVDGEFIPGVYLRPSQGSPVLHEIGTVERTISRKLDALRPAPYRIRLRPDDGVDPKQVIVDYDAIQEKLTCEGMSAKVIIE